MIEHADLYAFLEGSFDYLLAVGPDETVLHASDALCRACGCGQEGAAGATLERLLAPASLESFRSGLLLAREGARGIVLFSPRREPSRSIPLKTGQVASSGGQVFLFFGASVDGLGTFGDREKTERVKELFCIYSTAEWIEASTSIKEFFARLPEFLSRGMQYPERAEVHSVYQGQEYGTPISGSRFISAKLVVSRQAAGEIRVGYDDERLDLLPMEQRMLDEIARMLNLALERKELAERLALKQEEEADYRRRFAELEEQIAARTEEFEQQSRKLEQIDSYLQRVNRGWEESRAWLETVLKGIPEEVALIDRNRNLVMTNQKDAAPGGKCHKALFNREAPCEDCRLARIFREKTPITLDIENEGRHYQVHALPIFNQEHEVDGIMEFYRDVTLEKTYERQLQQADQLASLGQLVSGIGHEINNPNQFIRGNVKILKQALEDMLPIVDEYKRSRPDLKIARLNYDFFRQHIMTLVDDMAHGSERIKGIVEGLRRFARRDEGLLIDKVDINTLVEACARLVANEVHKYADIKLDLGPDIPAFIGNSQKIEQVLVNLVVNAAQAMPEERRGLVTVRTRNAGGIVVIEVEDDGKGMNAKTLKQIFDPFFTTKRAKGGTGLGLPIAYRIVEEHGGHISVTSTPGEGTLFTVTIPIKNET